MTATGSRLPVVYGQYSSEKKCWRNKIERHFGRPQFASAGYIYACNLKSLMDLKNLTVHRQVKFPVVPEELNDIQKEFVSHILFRFFISQTFMYFFVKLKCGTACNNLPKASN